MIKIFMKIIISGHWHLSILVFMSKRWPYSLNYSFLRWGNNEFNNAFSRWGSVWVQENLFGSTGGDNCVKDGTFIDWLSEAKMSILCHKSFIFKIICLLFWSLKHSGFVCVFHIYRYRNVSIRIWKIVLSLIYLS